MSTIGVENLITGLDSNKLLFLIRVSETTECYDDMVKFVKQFIVLKSQKGEDLDKDERNLFSAAYRNVACTKRASWRTLSQGLSEYEYKVDKYRDMVENELEVICLEVLELLATKLYKNVEGNESEAEIFYLRMFGDYNHHLSEIKVQNESYKHLAEEYYQKALDIAEAKLPPIHTTRLRVALNFSVFCHEILKDTERACALAKTSFDSAMETLDDADSNAMEMLKLLRENESLWSCENDDVYEDNDGIDITKYGKKAKVTRHDPNSEESMLDMQKDMKQLGLMPQNKDDENNPMDQIRDNLYDIFAKINYNEQDHALYEDVIRLILEYEAYIDFSRFKCANKNEGCTYFGCDVFDCLCSGCFERKYGRIVMKERCLENMESIAIRVEWQRSEYVYYSMISMASLCSVKILFRILNRNSYRCNYLNLQDESYNTHFVLERYEPLRRNVPENDEGVKQKKEIVERCITDFGIYCIVGHVVAFVLTFQQ
eukprot:557011_1